MADPSSIYPVLTAGGGAVAYWFFDKIAGAYVEQRATRYIAKPGQQRPFVERLAEELDRIRSQHDELTALAEALIERANRLQMENLELKRALAQQSGPEARYSDASV